MNVSQYGFEVAARAPASEGTNHLEVAEREIMSRFTGPWKKKSAERHLTLSSGDEEFNVTVKVTLDLDGRLTVNAVCNGSIDEKMFRHAVSESQASVTSDAQVGALVDAVARKVKSEVGQRVWFVEHFVEHAREKLKI